MRNIVRWMLNKINGVRTAEQGVITLEFSLIFGVFLLLIFFIFELCRYVVISAVIDLTLSRSARVTSTSQVKNTQYTALFNKTLKQEGGIWAGFIDANKFRIDVKYCQTLSHAIRKSCTTTAHGGKALAIYRVDYDYQPLLYTGVIPGTQELINALKKGLSFQLVYVQEYERDEHSQIR